jgi:4-hydroxybenzoate polyprenyltransferase
VSRARGLIYALMKASHPMPAIAVTAFVVAFALAAGVPGPRTALLAAAVFAGQLSVGWCNDYLDAGRDAAAGRWDKPVPAGLLSASTVGTGAVAALASAVALSVLLGTRPAVIHLVAVGSAWSYNAWLKFTPASFLPYLVSFALVPAVLVAATLPGSPVPRATIALAAGLLGVSAHFANTIGDERADAVTGVRGLPQRLGPRASAGVSAALVVAVAAVLLVLVGGRPLPVVFLAGAATLGGAGVAESVVRRSAGSALAFRLNVAAAALVVTGFVASGSALTTTS